MLDLQTTDQPGQADERDWQYDRIADLSRQAREVMEENLHRDRGCFVPRPYPWMREEHLVRSDELVALLNVELLEAGTVDGIEPACDVRQ